MAGRIKDEDIQLVRERTRIDEVIEQYVTLKNAGGGSRKGLCPFHDEKSPSFNVRPSVGSYHCFGCGAGGDVFKFVMEIEGLSFVETVERLAAKGGITLRYEDGGTPGPRRDPNQRPRLLAAHREAGEFYAATLQSSPDAQAGRQFVKDRGFDQAAAETFGMGFAPRGGEQLVAHLKGKGYTDDELVVGGLASRGSRGLYDRFRGRLLWPIREMTGEIIGFGARRMFDDDRVEAKYLNTSETPIYKKSQVLYGLDLARRSISSSGQAVIVEGYTDVMACHEAGVKTAVATCGTAFGEDHARVMRRLMLDDQAFHGEVIFTFDGDEAGQRAAIKTFNGDQQFVAQTYVAVEPRGMDPCDLRLADGDAAVRDLVASRVPLYRFVLENMLRKYDLDRGDQRVDAVREAVGLASAIRDRSKVDELLREIAGRVGTDVDQVRGEHRRRLAFDAKDAKAAASGAASAGAASVSAAPAAMPSPAVNFGLPQFADEREALKAIVQHPHLAAARADDLGDNDFTHPISKVLWKHIDAMPWPTAPDSNWLPQLADSVPDDDAKRILSIAAVEPLRAREGNTAAVVTSVILRLQMLTLGRRIAEVKSKLQRTNPIDEAETYNRMFGELIALEQQLRELRDRALSGDDGR
ncbi:DNA primase [Aeromicrobium fastidiosum]|uniref:DNA primase n=1 Tax=Aeromicrobium fastidiosum TaxID=52699 RepID=A0A641AN14_9ACTN|nr:DNA primase [Aeromicrobium fastidiosum]KAA1378519.1 DNA primase [Aeromicrobium fastidiosum]MBP2392512.1 DNA primase [Aeromicrobium fastidiosum]